MDIIVNEFGKDLETIVSQLNFIDELRSFSSCSPLVPKGTDDDFLAAARDIHANAKLIHNHLPIISGTLILYTCGRFESMARTLFEDLCQRLVSKADKFDSLPKKMRDNLTIYTAKIIAEPRKYGHAENGVRSFVATLAANLDARSPFSKVNHECLSITDTNMRAEALNDLFARVGAEKVWFRISEQAAVKHHFQELDTGTTEAKAKKKLNELMDLRNKIAHPAGELDWPSTSTILDYVNFLKIIATALSAVTLVYEMTLCAEASI
ncbi:hypothetical protein DT594_11285 [Halopseudomonas laoshanensis]|uniref:RiboL-PSP-HEPN domain-containing protein n=1 Tax=Halopseudomonas laoshanensis TaxID=2268758 RepID=A0A7V7GUS0_9GAMM|nr:HEPN domain-containing protein [Halopseudomonas laoshanensis]KAA0693902.1 hypothetical protein DT594_11285 [Halopseudomonas laoshanensis]